MGAPYWLHLLFFLNFWDFVFKLLEYCFVSIEVWCLTDSLLRRVDVVLDSPAGRCCWFSQPQTLQLDEVHRKRLQLDAILVPWLSFRKIFENRCVVFINVVSMGLYVVSGQCTLKVHNWSGSLSKQILCDMIRSLTSKPHTICLIFFYVVMPKGLNEF